MKVSLTKSWSVILTLLALAFSTIGVTAHAATFTVTNLNDSGAGSLRQAISDANAFAGADTIIFSASGTITLFTTLPTITDADGLTIDGTGQTLTISGNNAVRVMEVGFSTSLTLNNLTIANGSAPGDHGGGIHNFGTLTVTNSSFSGNSTSGGFYGGYGGGISNEGTSTITNSTFTGNSAVGGYGGGVYSNGFPLTITNSTFSGNNANVGLGGAIFTSGGTLITNSTFSGNSASSGTGAGVYSNNVGGATLRNTIVANSVGAANCFGAITNGGNNIDDGTTCGWGTASGSRSSTNPLLGALANNGGPTQTFALLTSSPAIDGVTFSAPNGAPSTDQRGVARPQGVRYDIGAFEGSETQAGAAFIVNTTADTNDGFCDISGQGIGNKDCSLREAINAANALTGANTITFSVSGTITLASTLPIITDAAGLTMDGTGQTLTISGNNAVRVMQVGAGALLTLNNLTIANGIGTGQGGGGISNSGTATITNSTFSGNSAPGGFGGGILNNGIGSTLTIANSIFSGNSGTGSGIFNDSGTLTITNSTFSGNTGSSVYNSGAPLTITNSTFSGNSATGGSGAGVFNGGTTLTITNSTFSGNSANNGSGAGVFNNGGPLTITNSTFSGNSATGGFGAAIKNNNVASQVTLRNTIVANSIGAGSCNGGITNGGNNIDDGTTCGWGTASGSRSSTNPLLGALANNGGPTQTFALLTSSPAIDGVTFSAPNGAPSTDQRGVARPQGVRYDIGAFEGSETQAGAAFIVNTTADTNDGFCDISGQGIGNKDCSLREAINAANALTGANTITFSVSGTITLASTLPIITDAAGLTMDGTGQTLTISGNNAVRVMQVGVGASLTLNNLTIANGNAPAGSGGGISNFSSTLTITNSTFSGNSATGGSGGGINNNSGTLTIANSTFSGNSTVGGFGGGVSNNGGTLTITNSTFAGNSANGGAGGGIFTGGGTLITNSTFSGNSGTGGSGAGVYNNGIGGVTLRNTIVANSVGAGNCGGVITNGGNNIDDGATCGWGAVSSSRSTTNPLLGALATNGGRTRTFALLAGSPAIDGVTFSAPNSAPSTDQRGVARPQGARYDIGAYEFSGFPLNAILFLLLD